jgi:hypothetical protein
MASSFQRLERDTQAMLIPAWRLPAFLVAVSLVWVALLPGASPTVLFPGVLIVWLVAACLFVALRRRGRATLTS